jgi:hypothetical protein
MLFVPCDMQVIIISLLVILALKLQMLHCMHVSLHILVARKFLSTLNFFDEQFQIILSSKLNLRLIWHAYWCSVTEMQGLCGTRRLVVLEDLDLFLSGISRYQIFLLEFFGYSLSSINCLHSIGLCHNFYLYFYFVQEAQNAINDLNGMCCFVVKQFPLYLCS